MAFLTAALQLTPLVVQCGMDIAQFVTWALAVNASPTGPTDTDWSTLQSKEDAIRAHLVPPIVAAALATTGNPAAA